MKQGERKIKFPLWMEGRSHNQRVIGTVTIHTFRWLLEQAAEQIWKCLS